MAAAGKHGVLMSRCEHCEEREATHQALVRKEVLSDERGTLYRTDEMWLCDECDPQRPEPDS